MITRFVSLSFCRFVVFYFYFPYITLDVFNPLIDFNFPSFSLLNTIYEGLLLAHPSMITLEALPEELLYKILVYCDLETINHVSLASQRLHIASRDNLLWHHFCQTDLETIAFHPSARKLPPDGYRAEYLYQRHIDTLVDEYVHSIVDNPATRFEKILTLSRIGLRCRPKLLDIFSHPDYETYNLRHRYYASELIQTISYRQAVLRALNMFKSNDRFDTFQFYLAFDAFQHGISVYKGPSSELTYGYEITLIRKVLMPIKIAFEADTHSQHSGIPKRNSIQNAAQLLGSRLYSMNLILDIKDQPDIGGYRAELGEHFLREVFTNYDVVNGIPSFNTPSYALLRAAVYVYFARWIGLDASIAVLEFDTFVRIEDPSRSQPKSLNSHQSKGCFFADLNRAGKVREVEDMMELIRIANSSNSRLRPSTRQEIIEIFSRECINVVFPRTNQFEDKSDCILFLGAMICSFLCSAAHRQKALGLSVPVWDGDSTTRLDIWKLSSHRCSLESIIEYSNELSARTEKRADELAALNPGTERYNEDRLTHRYSMAIPAITFQVPCALVLLTDFLLPLAPSTTRADDKVRTLESVIDKLVLKDKKTLGVPTTPYAGDSPVAEFYAGDLVFHGRTGQYGVIINSWLNEPSPRGDGQIQHTAYMQGCHHLTVRETSIQRPGYGIDFDRLMVIDASFFGVEVGLYCLNFKMLPDCTSSFILAPELQPLSTVSSSSLLSASSASSTSSVRTPTASASASLSSTSSTSSSSTTTATATVTMTTAFS